MGKTFSLNPQLEDYSYLKSMEKLKLTLEKTSRYKIKDGKIYSRIDGEWKELNDYTKTKKGN